MIRPQKSMKHIGWFYCQSLWQIKNKVSVQIYLQRECLIQFYQSSQAFDKNPRDARAMSDKTNQLPKKCKPTFSLIHCNALLHLYDTSAVVEQDFN